MTNIQPMNPIPQNFYKQPQTSDTLLPNVIEKAEETIRRTNLQSAAKTPAGAAVAALKYVAADAIKANIMPENNILNAGAAIKQYSK